MRLDKLADFAKKVGQFAPMILALTPLAPIAPAVALGIQEAEAIRGASGPEKLAHVVKIAKHAADAANAQAGKEVIDAAQVEATAGQVVSAVVSTVNLVETTKAKAA